MAVPASAQVSSASPQPFKVPEIAPVSSFSFLFFLIWKMHITSPVVRVNYEQPASSLFLMCLGRAARNEAVLLRGKRGLPVIGSQRVLLRCEAEHVLCPLASISLMVHLYLWCAEVSTRRGCLRAFFSLVYIYTYTLAWTWTLHPSAVFKGSTCICLANG